MCMIRFIPFLFLVVTCGASAQQQARPDDNSPERRDMVRVQVNLSYSVPLTSSDADEILKAQDAIRRKLYVVADKECALLAETIASVCRLENVNVNVNRQRQVNAENINANLSMTFRVQLKP